MLFAVIFMVLVLVCLLGVIINCRTYRIIPKCSINGKVVEINFLINNIRFTYAERTELFNKGSIVRLNANVVICFQNFTNLVLSQFDHALKPVRFSCDLLSKFY